MIAARDDAPFQGCAAGAGADTIRLDAQVYVLSLPGPGEGANMTGDLDLGTQSLGITGKGAAATAIDASGLDRAFDLLEGASLALEDLTIRNGRTPQGDPGEEGGAVRSRGSVSALRVAFVGNSAGNGSSGSMGGGLVGSGGPGGAISSRLGSGPPPSLTVVDSSFTGNLAGDGGQFSGPGSGGGGNGGRGGAIEAIGGTLAISGLTFAGNLAGDGGNGGTGPVTPGAGGDGGVGGAIYAAFGSVAITTQHVRGQPRRRRRAHGRQPLHARQGRHRRRDVRRLVRPRRQGRVLHVLRQPARAGDLRRRGERPRRAAAPPARSWPTPPRPARAWPPAR